MKKASSSQSVFTKTSLLSVGLLSVLSLSAAPAAIAGFEWVPAPSKAQHAAPMAQTQATIVTPSHASIAVPAPNVTVVKNSLPAAPAPVQAAAQYPQFAPINNAPVQQQPAQTAYQAHTSISAPVTLNQKPQYQTAYSAPKIMNERPIVQYAPAAPAQIAALNVTTQPINKSVMAPSRRLLIDPDPLGRKASTFPQATQPSSHQSTSFSPSTAQPSIASYNFSTVEGFGTDIPLALALSQIIPPEYAYSFRGTVNPGLKVSWTGGQPWNVVLSGILQSLGMNGIITQKTVIISQELALLNKYEDGILLSAFNPKPSVGAPVTQTAKMQIKAFPNATDLNAPMSILPSANTNLQPIADPSMMQVAESGLKKKLQILA